ncbi:hypothetical protein F2P56_008509 [Juglans regia]|uniref:Uncharacterized protein LOC108985286 isoform X1 n=2 Tax=Juglans regia TaxID=51240 RepID=A0A2I4E0Z0_JUGRE|nr:uncharacterized protein LOC108985286 isoform X1 [Juglans regia]KAF5471736.1 hypothetical protein F2P56_008509 [Juglans regia]
MSILYLLISRVFSVFLVCSVFLSCFPGLVLPAIVTLESLEIYNTHQWLPNTKPVVYFQCKGENKTVLPDVKEDHVFYNFKGEESWQPLTELPSKRCKRCGFYEENSFVSDDVYEEWEFCHSDFTEPDGKYIRFKEKEFNATFLCSKCVPSANASNSASSSQDRGKGMHAALIILISVVVSTVLVLGVVAVYKYWQKKKREQDQARFLKLFEDGDDIEDELGLGNVI